MTDEDALETVLSNGNGIIMLVTGIVLIIIFILFTIWFKKSAKKNRERTRQDFQNIYNYYTNLNEKHNPSGIISVSGDEVVYTRGSRSMKFKIIPGNKVYLCPSLISEWFAVKNYSLKEEETILHDIKNYLVDNRICRTAEVITDEEYDKIYCADLDHIS